MAIFFNRLNLKEVTKVQVRYKNGPNHWSVLAKKRSAKDKALAHFDDFYAKVYGPTWPHIRSALLQENSKYVAVVNNYSDNVRIKQNLELCGAMNIRSIYESQKKAMEEESNSAEKDCPSNAHRNQINDRIENVLSTALLSEVQSLYPADYDAPTTVDLAETDREGAERDEQLKPVELRSIDLDLRSMEEDSARVIRPSAGLSGLNEFVPATKLKGLDDWVLESEHYEFYKKGAALSVNVIKEDTLNISPYLNVYTFEEGNDSKFQAPKRGSTGVFDYYLFDGSSLLPVLALDLQVGDVVLDMCGAPGGKGLAAFQTFMPKVMVINDVSQSRVNKIKNVLQQYMPDINTPKEMLFVTQQDARWIEETGLYNKILVDVPCTTDRHNLHVDDNNMFKPSRVKERLKLPELQAEILTNALKIVAVGGTVVYSTCSLSPVQNDGVVQVALKKAREENNCIFIVKDLSEALKPLSCLYKFGNFGLRYGHIVIPTRRKNWGPMYFCKIVKVQ